MKSILKYLITAFDFQIANLLSVTYEKKGSVIVILIHSIFKDRSAYTKNHCDPQQHLTVNDLRLFIECMLNAGYQFIAADKIGEEMDRNKKYAVITFDDGYFNNINVLALLEEYKTPATVYVSIGHILQNKSFWWDVIYRENINKNKSEYFIQSELIKLKKLKNAQIEEYILENYGKSCFSPISDIDRPLKEDELKDFAKHKFIHIGNHTFNHALLTNYSTEEAKQEILSAQHKLNEIIGYYPNTFAYPNGYYNDNTPLLIKNLGFKTAITVVQQKSYLPISQNSIDAMKIPRFLLWGGEQIKQQSISYRSDFHLTKNPGLHFFRKKKVK